MLNEEQKLRHLITSIFEEEDEEVKDDTADDGDDFDFDLGDDSGSDEGGDVDTGGPSEGGDDLEGDEDLEGGDDLGGSDEGGAGGISTSDFGDRDEESDSEEMTAEKEPEEEPEESVTDDVSSDVDQVKEMFKDTGNPEIDYSLSNPNNKKLAKFKFIYAEIDLDKLLSAVDKEVGVSEKELLDRLTPEQRQMYYDKSQELRDMFDGIEEREKNIKIWNSNIPLSKKDDNGKEVSLNSNEIKEAFKKIDKYMSKRFSNNWQDDIKAVNFLQEIKIDFDENGGFTIEQRMISHHSFEVSEEGEINNIPFNKIYVEMPPYLEKFVQSMIDNEDVKESSIFRTLSAAYTETQAANNSPYVIIGGAEAEEEEGDVESETETAEEEPADTGEENEEEPVEAAEEETADPAKKK